MYQVLVNNTIVKTYPFKAQAVVYCYMNGYVYSGGYDFGEYWYRFLDDRVKIRKLEDETNQKAHSAACCRSNYRI